MRTSRLFTATAVIEAATGLALLVSPGAVIAILIGATVAEPGGSVVARVAALALIAIGIVCWMARKDEQSAASRGLRVALLFYNGAIVLLLIHAALALKLSAIGLWPAVAAHAVFALWCAVELRTPAAPTR